MDEQTDHVVDMRKCDDYASENNHDQKHVSQEQLLRELDFWRAQRILASMLDTALISLSEFNKISALNRQSFSPALAQIMPDMRC